MKLRKIDIARKECLHKYFKGESFQHKQNPKEHCELSSNGKDLYCFTYKILEATDKIINDKRIYIRNGEVFNYVDEYGTIPHGRYRIIDRLLNELLDNEIHNVLPLFIGSNDGYSLSPYIRLFTTDVFNCTKRPESVGRWRYVYHFRKWGLDFQSSMETAKTILNEYGVDPLVGIRIPQKSIEEIQSSTSGKWKQMAYVMAYWVCGGCRFTEADDEFVRQHGHQAVKWMYSALGGRYRVGSTSMHDMYWVLSPNTPIDDIPLYLTHKEESVIKAAKYRMERGY